MKRRNVFSLFSIWMALALGPASASEVARGGSTGATGEVYGRVFNTAGGIFLNNARITVRETAREVQTDSSGSYRLSGLPVGIVNIVASYSGLSPQSTTVGVEVGKAIRQDFDLGPQNRTDAAAVVTLDPFSVEAARLSTQALATNEQRYAPNIKNVVAAGEFGDSSEGNVADLMKYVPGIDVSYNANVAVGFSIRGFPGAQTLVTLDGGAIANSSGFSSGTGRAIELDGLRLNNISRVEVTKVPTPDLPANAQGGAVNVISKNGFDRAKPVLTYRAFGYYSSNRPFGTYYRYMPGLDDKPVQPGFNMSYELPVNKSLALSFSAGASGRNFEYRGVASEWNLSPAEPVLYRTTVVPQVVNIQAADVSLGSEWRMGPDHKVRVNLLHTVQTRINSSERVQFIYEAGAAGNADYVQGAATGVGSALMRAFPYAKRNSRTTQLNLGYAYTGSIWTLDASGYMGRDRVGYRDIDFGYFADYSATISNLVIRGDDLYRGFEPSAQPRSVSAVDRTGRSIDLLDAGSYSLASATSSWQYNMTDAKRGLKFNATTEPVRGLVLKAGVATDLQQRDARRMNYQTWTFRPGASATDRQVKNYDLKDDRYTADAQNYFPGRQVQWLNTVKLYELFKAQPQYFVPNEATSHQQNVTFSKKLQETISAAYVRADLKKFDNRLWLVGGVRFERTTDEGWGPLNDPSAIYQRDSQGKLIRDSAGRLIAVTTDAAARAKLQYIERGAFARRDYDGFYPSMNASLRLTEDITVRSGYARTIGRPNFTSIIPGVTITDPSAATNTISVINTGLLPWTSDAYDLSLESYAWQGGTGSIGVFAKDVSNFFGQVREIATPDLLSQYDIPLEYPGQYDGYQIVTTQNVGKARIKGMEASYRQPLVFLPGFLKKTQVYANVTALNLHGPNAADFSGFAPRILNWGVSYAGPRFAARINVNQKTRVRSGLAATSARVPANTYGYVAPRTVIGADFQFRLSKWVSVYGTAINLTNSPVIEETYAPTTPMYARNTRVSYFGADVTFGLKGTF